MSETPKCPYCGDRMKIRVSLTTPDWGLLSAQYKCMTCESTSPRIEFSSGTSNEKIIERLQAAAMRRTEPKNRVLTLEEVVRSEVMWYEQRTMQGVRVVILGYAQNELGFTQLINYLGDKFYRRDDAYNDFWRCWLRKPTEAERRETPWEGDSRE